MSNEKSRADLLAEATLKEDSPRYPSSKLYKSTRYEQVRGLNEFEGVEIKVGSKVVCRHAVGKETLGYVLGRVIDFQENDSFWDKQSSFIVEITKVSQPTLEHFIGRYRCVGIDGSGFSWVRSKFGIVAVGGENWKKYLPTGNSVN